jgi:hypothetical protein
MYFLEEDGVFVYIKKIFSYEKYVIYFEDMNLNSKEKKIFPMFWAILTCTMFIFFIILLRNELQSNELFNISIFFFILGLFSLSKYIHYRDEYIIYYSDQYKLKLFRNRPSKKEVDIFTSILLEKYKEYMAELVSSLRGNSKIDSLERIANLLNIDAITFEEYNKIKNEFINKIDSGSQFLNSPMN